MTKRKKLSIIIECESCNGSGLYSGFMEAKGQAVVCITCDGTGAVEISGKQFTGRKGRRGIKQVRFGSGLIIDNPSKQAWMSYDEFKKTVSTWDARFRQRTQWKTAEEFLASEPEKKS